MLYLGHPVILFVVFEGFIWFPQRLYQLASSPAMCEISPFLTPSPGLIVISFLVSCSDGISKQFYLPVSKGDGSFSSIYWLFVFLFRAVYSIHWPHLLGGWHVFLFTFYASLYILGINLMSDYDWQRFFSSEFCRSSIFGIISLAMLKPYCAIK